MIDIMNYAKINLDSNIDCGNYYTLVEIWADASTPIDDYFANFDYNLPIYVFALLSARWCR